MRPEVRLPPLLGVRRVVEQRGRLEHRPPGAHRVVGSEVAGRHAVRDDRRDLVDQVRDVRGDHLA